MSKPKIIWKHEDLVPHPATGQKYMWRIVDGVDGGPFLENSVVGERGLDAMGVRSWCRCLLGHADIVLMPALVESAKDLDEARLLLHAYSELVRLRIPFNHASPRFGEVSAHDGTIPQAWMLIWNHGDKRTALPQASTGIAHPWAEMPTMSQVTEALETYVKSTR